MNKGLKKLLPLAAVLVLFAACGGEEEPEPVVRSYLSGTITVSPEVDTVADYRGFEVIVTRTEGEELDTLGYAVTDSAGAFALEVAAPERGIYPLFITRRGTILKVDELAVAEGDTATFNVVLPIGNRQLRIRSPENAAWMAYENTKAQYNQSLYRLVQEDAYTEEEVARSIAQTAGILWSMRETFPNTLGSQLAAAESVLMLSDWNDSLLVERARAIEPDNPGYLEVVRAARQAQGRVAGPEAGFALLESFLERAQAEVPEEEETLAALEAERVLALLEGGRQEEAQQAARELVETYPETTWADWAERALYDFENLMPGMTPPDFSATTVEGEPVRLDSLRGQLVLLEFYSPLEETYQREIEDRNALFQIAGEEPFTVISVSVLPDTVLNEAFYEDRDLPGLHVIAPGGLEGELAQRFNVSHLPRRFLISPEGEIVGRFEGGSITAVQQEVAARLREEEPAS